MKIGLLQGPSTPFFRWLAEAMVAAGHQPVGIGFCGGDELYWRLGGRTPLPFIRCPAGEAGLTDWYGEWLDREQPDALLLFGDCRAVHRPIIALAKARNVPLFVLEEGYLRPHWITLEEGGVNAYSPLPREAAAYLPLAEQQSEEPPALPPSLRRRVVMDIAYHLANGLLCWRYPAYRTHRPYPIWQEYRYWLLRLMRMQWRKFPHRRIIQGYIEGHDRAFFLYPLQLDSDAQLRVHSPYGSQAEAMEEVMASFARSAPEGSLLLIKGHPLDNGMQDMQTLTRRLARRYGVADRVDFVDGGHLPSLLRHCRGVVVVNSTVGLSALQHHLPVHCLGTAVYDLPGLTHQGELHDFWQHPPKPDSRLLQGFREYLIRHALVYGSFFRKVDACLQQVVERVTQTVK